MNEPSSLRNNLKLLVKKYKHLYKMVDSSISSYSFFIASETTRTQLTYIGQGANDGEIFSIDSFYSDELRRDPNIFEKAKKRVLHFLTGLILRGELSENKIPDFRQALFKRLTGNEDTPWFVNVLVWTVLILIIVGCSSLIS